MWRRFLGWLRERWEAGGVQYRARLKVRLRRQILKDLAYMRQHSNRGLLHSRLFRMPGVQFVEYEGIRIYDRVTVRMDDGFIIQSFQTMDEAAAFREAAVRVAVRWRERWADMEIGNEHKRSD